MTSNTEIKNRADFDARIAAVRAAIAQRHAERAEKERAAVEAAERRAAAKLRRRTDAEAAALEARRAAAVARADEQRRLNTQREFATRQAATPTAPVADPFPPIPGGKYVRGTMGPTTWASLHMLAQRKALSALMAGATPTDIERARRLLDMTKDHLRVNVRQEIFDRATRPTNN